MARCPPNCSRGVWSPGHWRLVSAHPSVGRQSGQGRGRQVRGSSRVALARLPLLLLASFLVSADWLSQSGCTISSVIKNLVPRVADYLMAFQNEFGQPNIAPRKILPMTEYGSFGCCIVCRVQWPFFYVISELRARNQPRRPIWLWRILAANNIP
ncbi:hypothetical protein VTK26DRAFT_7865 [Humicola hyalothermophila]